MNQALNLLLAALLAAPFTLLSQENGATAQQPSPAPAPQSTTVTVVSDVSYGRAGVTDLRLDVYEPAGAAATPRPAVILIHGGGWDSLDKSTMQGMGQFLARFGFVSFAVDYRLLHGSENRWPAQLDDVQRAVRWIRANAGRYAISPDRIGAFGHSAGAQLAALLGMEDTRDNSDPALAKYSSRVQAVVDVSGPTDFTTSRDPGSVAFLNNFLGGDYGTHPDVWREASPAFHATKDDAPFLIVHGTQDQNVPLEQAQELYSKLKAAGAEVSIVEVQDGHRFESAEARRTLAIETLGFFDRWIRAAQSNAGGTGTASGSQPAPK